MNINNISIKLTSPKDTELDKATFEHLIIKLITEIEKEFKHLMKGNKNYSIRISSSYPDHIIEHVISLYKNNGWSVVELTGCYLLFNR